MSWSANRGRVLRGTTESSDVFVMGEDLRAVLPTHSAISDATELLRAGEERAGVVLAAAEAEAAQRIALARAEADAVRRAAYGEGFAAGQQSAAAEVEACVEVARRAAAEGKAIRDELASQAAMVVARAVSLAVRRIVGEYYAQEPGRTVAICAEAMRSATGQEILAVRVHPDVAAHVQAALVNAERYVQPDSSMAIGGCIIDVRNGTIDASLDARLNLLDLALTDSAGEAAA